jgi:hypothetical protein
MKMTKSMLFAFVALAVINVVGCRSHSPTDNALEIADSEAVEIIVSTPWLDTIPNAPDDKFSLFGFEGEIGVFVTGNQFRGSYDMFGYEIDRKTLTFHFFADDKTAKSKFKLERVRKGDFDFRLTMKDSPRGPKVYYGFDLARGAVMSAQAAAAWQRAKAVVADRQHSR